MVRSVRSVLVVVATLAVAASVIAAGPAPVIRSGKPSLKNLLPGGDRPEPLHEALAAQQFEAQRMGIVDPALGPQAVLEARAQAGAIKTASGAYGRGWREVGPKPYVSDDPNYNDIYGGTNNAGWGVVSGRVTALASDPSDKRGNTIYVGTAGGGVWVTRNGGKTWKPIWDDKPTLAIGAIAFDSKRPKNIYVGTGEGNFGGGTMFRGVGVYRSTDGGKTFHRVRKNVNANVVSAIAARNGLVLVATDRGLWRSTDGGATYHDTKLPTNAAATAPHNGMFGSVVSDVEIHPSKPNRITAAVGWVRGKLWAPGNGLYRSDKGGAPGTWRKLDVPEWHEHSVSNDPIGRVSLAYASGPGQNHDTLWAIVQDAGLLNNKLRNDVNDPALATVLNGVYKSTDDAESWELYATGASFAAAPGSGIAALSAVYMAGGQSWYNQWVAVSPTDENVVLVGLEEIYQLESHPTPGVAATWRTVGRYWNTCTGFVNAPCDDVPVGPYSGAAVHPDQHAAVFTADGSRLYIGSDGGVYSQAPQNGVFGTQWDNHNATLGTTQPYYAVMAADGTVLAGFQDNGVSKTTPDGYSAMIFGGDGGDMAVEPDNSDHIWEEYVFAGVSRSTDGGRTWLNVAPEVTAPQFIAPFEMDPRNKNHLVLGAREIVETTAGINTICANEFVASGARPPERIGCDWKLSFDLGQNTSVTPAVNFSTSAIDIHKGIIYAGYCGTCAVLSADPTSEAKVRSGIATNYKPGCTPVPGSDACWHHAKAKGLPNRFITDVTIDPRNPKIVYATLAGFSRRWLPPSSKARNVGRGHVFVSRDGGETFTDISRNLPDLPAESLEIKGDRLFLGTHSGVYTAAKAGAAWERLGRGLPNAPALDLSFNPQGTQLLVATHGRGMWTYSLAAPAKKAAKIAPVRAPYKAPRTTAVSVASASAPRAADPVASTHAAEPVWLAALLAMLVTAGLARATRRAVRVRRD